MPCKGLVYTSLPDHGKTQAYGNVFYRRRNLLPQLYLYSQQQELGRQGKAAQKYVVDYVRIEIRAKVQKPCATGFRFLNLIRFILI